MKLPMNGRPGLSLVTAVFVMVVACLSAARGAAQTTCHTLQRTFINDTPGMTDAFGSSVAISGNNILVGTGLDDTGAADAGSAFLFDAATGDLLHTFNNPTPEESDYFGFSVAISGNDVLVGANRDDSSAPSAGIAYLFDAATGGLVRTFSNPTPEAFDNFGYSVAIWGNSVLVGAPEDDTGAPSAGSAYLFDASTGALLQTFNNPTPAAGDWFGNAVAISSIYVVVGAFWDDTGATDAGSGYLFNATNGELLQTFKNPSPVSGDWFASSVAVTGVNVFVAAPFKGEPDGSAVYHFFSQNGILLRTFWGGKAFSIDGNNLLLGNAGSSSSPGRAFLFDVSSGSLLRNFQSPSPSTHEFFGSDVAISGNNIVIGAAGFGRAYLYACVPATRAQIMDYLLGKSSDPSGLDANEDGRVDVADLVAAPE